MEGNQTKKLNILLIVMLFIIPSSVNVISTEETNTIYVDDDNTDGPWDGTLEYPFQFIQDGIDAANDFGTVFVFNGTYHENLIMNETIQLIGEEKNSTKIDRGTRDEYLIQVFAKNCKISQFTIGDNGNDTLFFSGVYIGSSSNNITITGNIIQNNSLNGIMIYSSKDNIITENSIIGNKKGVVVELSDSNKIIGNNIIGSTESVSYGILIDSSDNNTILGNSISGNKEGIYIDNSNENTIIGNDIVRNDWGIEIFESYSSNVIGNNISGCHDIAIGLYFTIGNNIISNSIRDNEQGIELGGSFWNSIKENNFVNSKSIHALTINSYLNFWFYNYWDNWPGLIPKPILTEIVIITLFFYWVQFDWHPAQEPYNIDT